MNKFFDMSSFSLRKVDDAKTGEKEKKIMTDIVATNIISSQPPEQQPTAMATACAKVSGIL